MIRLAALLLCASAGSGPASRALLAHAARGVATARVGQWVTYRADAGAGRVSYWRFAVVEEARDAAGRAALWVELEIGQHRGLAAPLAQLRALVGQQSGQVTRLFMAVGADPAFEVDPASTPLGRALEPDGPTRAAVDVRAGPARRLRTSAGTVEAIPVEVLSAGAVAGRWWVSREVPLFQLARVELPSIGQVAEVQEFGVDASPRMILPDPKARKIRLDPGGAP